MNDNLIQDVYKELVDLGWPNLKNKEETNPCLEIDISSYKINKINDRILNNSTYGTFGEPGFISPIL